MASIKPPKSVFQCRDVTRASRVLDALDMNVAVLDSQGFIVYTNQVWQDFANDNPLPDGSPPRNVNPGVNYLEICRVAKGPSSENSLRAYEGIQAVMDGRKRSFSQEYPCHSPNQARWFRMRVKPLRHSGQRETLVIHEDITDRVLAEKAFIAQREALHEQLAKLQTMIGELPGFANTPGTPVAGLRLEASAGPGADAEPYRALLDALSNRELEIMTAIVRGERNADTASRLKISPKSVSTYRARVLDKLRVETDAQLAALVLRAGYQIEDGRHSVPRPDETGMKASA